MVEQKAVAVRVTEPGDQADPGVLGLSLEDDALRLECPPGCLYVGDPEGG